MIHLYLNASELAQACNLNPYAKPEKLIAKYLHKKKEHTSLESIESTIKKLPNLKRVREELEKRNVVTKKPNLSDEEVIKQATVNCINSSVQTNKPLEGLTKLKQVMIQGGVSKQDCKNISTDVVSAISKHRGTQLEKKDLAKKFGSTLAKNTKESVQMTYRTLLRSSNYRLRIGGKIDGKLDDGRIIESKRRMYRLLGVRPYEKVQCHAYMFLLDKKQCILLETFKDEQQEHIIDFDEEYWTEIKTLCMEHYCEPFFERKT